MCVPGEDGDDKRDDAVDDEEPFPALEPALSAELEEAACHEAADRARDVLFVKL